MPGPAPPPPPELRRPKSKAEVERDRLLRLIAAAVDSETGWQNVEELQAFLREGVTG